MPAENEFWSKVASRYDEVVDLQIGPRSRSMVRDRVATEGRLGRLVELGCGTGFFTQVLAGRADHVVATDASPGMLDLARERVKSGNVRFETHDCQNTSLPDASFDTAFISLVLHFTAPGRTLAEMHRILKSSGTLLIVNLDPLALRGLDRIRCLARIAFRGLAGYRMKPPKGLGNQLMTENQLRELLSRSGFRVVGVETIRDPARSSHIPLQYVKAVKQ